MKYQLKDIAGICGAELSGPEDLTVSRIGIDSRTISDTEGLLFVAINGERHDGHKFIPELLERGVRAFLVEQIPETPHADAGFIRVRDSLQALQVLASRHRSGTGAVVLGITGSNGKTIVKEWVHQVLSPGLRMVRSPKSYNSQIGVPLSVLQIEADTEFAVFEAGISRPGEMQKLEEMIRPELGIFTNIGEAHQEGFASREEKILEKLKLFAGSQKIVYCADRPEVHRLIRREFSADRLFSWSSEGRGEVLVKTSEASGEATELEISFKGEKSRLILPFRDPASVENAMHVVCLMLHLEIPEDLIISRIGELVAVAMRLEMLKGINGCTLINDSYNSDFISLSIAIDHLNRVEKHGQKTVILSDIRQSGRDPGELYRDVAGLLSKKKIDRFIGIGSELTKHRELFPDDSEFYTGTAEFLAGLPVLNFMDEAILIKGARVYTFERISERLQEKNHRTVLEINLDAMVQNLNYYRSLTRAKIMVMVKAFSYGSGVMEIAGTLQYQKVDYLCVAYVDEGIMLRESGIHLPILVMNPEVSGFDLMMDHSLEPELYNFRSLFSFIKSLERRNLAEYPVHIKLETGMNRLGFREEELDELFDVLEKNPAVRIRSVFSHLAASDDPMHDDFTREQIGKFDNMSMRITDRSGKGTLRHILNSSGIERFPEAAFDMVRLGIGLYGISPAPGTSLTPVSSLKSIISQIKSVNKGESVGYGRNYIAEKDLKIGIVPIGYADGLRRELGTRGVSFRVRDREAPVLGNICMDMTMIDLSGIPAEEGDEVLIFGPGKTVTELAEKLGTISYEILAGLSERVKRVYFHE